MNLEYFYDNRHQVKNLELYARQLPSWIDFDLMARFFDQWVSIKSLTIIKSCKKDSCSALIGFYDFDGMMIALTKSQGSIIGGKKIAVEFSKQAVLCCNTCWKFGHYSYYCPEKKRNRDQPFRFNKIWQNQNGEEIQRKSQSIDAEFELQFRKNKDFARRQYQRRQIKQSRQPNQSFFAQNMKNSNKKIQTYHKNKAIFYRQYYEEGDSTAETNYEEQDFSRKHRSRQTKSVQVDKSLLLEEKIEFVEIVRSNGRKDDWDNLDTDKRMRRLERQGFFMGTKYSELEFVRIVESKEIETEIDY